MAGQGRQRSEWNACLLKDAVAPAYVALLKEAQRLFAPNQLSHYMSLFPMQMPPAPWHIVVQTFLQLLRPPISTAVTTNASLSTSFDMVFCVIRQRFVPFNHVIAIDPMTCPSHRVPIIQDLLRVNEISYATFPPPLLSLLLEHHVLLGSTSPTTFRQLVREERLNIVPSQIYALLPILVKCCTDDLLQDSSPVSLEHLHSLPLLYVRNQTFQRIQYIKNTTSEHNRNHILVCSTLEQQLLEPVCAHRILDMEAGGSILASLPGFLACTNVKTFHVEDLVELAPQLFSSPASQSSKHLMMECPRHLRRWWPLFWKYLDDRFSIQRQCHDGVTSHKIAFPKGLLPWPCKPVKQQQNEHIALVLWQAPTLVLTSTNTMDPHLAQFLASIGIFLLDTTWLPHQHCPSWLLDTPECNTHILNADSLLSLLSNAADQRSTHAFHFSSEVSAALRTFICQEINAHCPFSTLSRSNQAFVMTLPLFPIHDTISVAESLGRLTQEKLVALNSGTYLLPPPTSPVSWLRQPFLATSSPQEYAFCLAAGIAQCTVPQFLITHLLPHLQTYPFQVQIDVLTDTLLTFRQQPESLQSNIAAVLMLPTAVNIKSDDDVKSTPKFRRVSELFDPTVNALNDLLGPNSFPVPELCTPLLLDVLRSLGLQQSLSCQGMVESASAISELVKNINNSNDNMTNHQRIEKQALQLLHVVNDHFDSMYRDTPDEDILIHLRRLQWLPVLQNPLHPSLPWKTNESFHVTASADVVWPQNLQWFGSGSRYILNGELTSHVLLKAFEWHVTPIIVANQLRALGRFWQEQNSHTNYKDELNYHIPLLYKALLDEETPTLPDDCRNILANEPWIWTGSNFVKQFQVAWKDSLGLEPLLFTAPVEW
jgi:hypothetical protein